MILLFVSPSRIPLPKAEVKFQIKQTDKQSQQKHCWFEARALSFPFFFF